MRGIWSGPLPCTVKPCSRPHACSALAFTSARWLSAAYSYHLGGFQLHHVCAPGARTAVRQGCSCRASADGTATCSTQVSQGQDAPASAWTAPGSEHLPQETIAHRCQFAVCMCWERFLHSVAGTGGASSRVHSWPMMCPSCSQHTGRSRPRGVADASASARV